MTSNGSSSTMADIPAWRTALAGAMAGSLTASALHPIDTAKTLRQASFNGSRTRIRTQAAASLWQVLAERVRNDGVASLYAGVVPAVLGSAPSSALYFGTYEVVRKRMYPPDDPGGRRLPEKQRLVRNMIAAAAGNVASSILFVPKEVIKNRMQTRMFGSSLLPALKQMVLPVNGGMASLYAGYTATLLRNIPSNMIKFAFYEECKLFLLRRKRLARRNSQLPKPFAWRLWPQKQNSSLQPPSSTVQSSDNHHSKLSPREHIMAGAVSGVLASGITTPMDVVKTRFATANFAELALSGRFGNRISLRSMVALIAKEQGVRGFFLGFRARIMWSAFFAALGFSSYEWCKQAVSPSRQTMQTQTVGNRVDLLRRRAGRAFPRPGRSNKVLVAVQ